MKIVTVIFAVLNNLDYIIWGYIGLIIIFSTGIYLSIKSRMYQFKILGNPKKYIMDLMGSAHDKSGGVHPIKLYFASVGGMIGLGNVVTVVSAVTVGGPGSVFWMWIASFAGMLVKYSEIYLGVRYRIRKKEKNHVYYDGGPMYYLKVAFSDSILGKVLPTFAAILLCIYGVEVSQFLIITDTITSVSGLHRYLIIAILLVLVFLVTIGGVRRLANTCSILIPFFLCTYILIALFIIVNDFKLIPVTLKLIFYSAFNGHAPIAGFAGSSVILAMHYGVARAVYSGDIGIGYDSIIQSETRTKHPEKQARMAIFALFMDTLICTITVFVILLTGLWKVGDMQLSEYIPAALSKYLPWKYVQIYTSILFFITGFTTIVAYFTVGQKCANFLHNKWGKPIYILYGLVSFIIFSFSTQEHVMLVMSVSGGMLMMINIFGILKLHKEIAFF